MKKAIATIIISSSLSMHAWVRADDEPRRAKDIEHKFGIEFKSEVPTPNGLYWVFRNEDHSLKTGAYAVAIKPGATDKEIPGIIKAAEIAAETEEAILIDSISKAYKANQDALHLHRTDPSATSN